MNADILREAIINLRPNAKFHFREISFEGIDWAEELENPLTKEELEAEVSRLESLE